MKSTSSAAVFAALGLLTVGSLGAPAARAADLGGDCCADLEERVAELEATSARKGNRKVSLTVSGQVETAIMAWDNGDRSDAYIVDVPTVGGTYFQFTGAAKISPRMSAGFQVQVAFDTGARSHQVTEIDDDGGAAGDTAIVVTLANWYLDSKDLGRLTVGRINTATSGATGVDLAGTGVIANVNIGYWNRSFTAIGSGGLTWSNLMGGNAVNGSTLSRANAISYTSQTYGGFQLSAAWGENDVWDAALRYAGEAGGFRFAAALGYVSNSGGLGDVSEDFGQKDVGPQPSQVKGSASLLHVPTGLYVQGAFVHQDNDNGLHDTNLYYVQAGLSKNWFGIGNTALYGEYSQVDHGLSAFGTGSLGADAVNLDSTAHVWGLGVVQAIDAAAMELFLSYRQYSADVDGGGEFSDPKDFNVVMGGARIKF